MSKTGTFLVFAIAAGLAICFSTFFNNEEKIRFTLLGVSFVLLFVIAQSKGLSRFNRCLITGTFCIALMVLAITTVPHPIPILIAMLICALLTHDAVKPSTQ